MLNASQDNVAQSTLVAEGKDGVSELETEVPTSMHAENVSPTVNYMLLFMPKDSGRYGRYKIGHGHNGEKN